MWKTLAISIASVASVVGAGYVGYSAYTASIERTRDQERSADLAVIFHQFSECKKEIPGFDTTPCDGWRDAYFALQQDQALRDARNRLEKIYRAYPHLRPVEKVDEAE